MLRILLNRLPKEAARAGIGAEVAGVNGIFRGV